MNALRQAAQAVRRTVVQTTVAVGSLTALLEVTTHLPSQGRSSPFYHTLCDSLCMSLLRRLDPETAHNLSIYAVKNGWGPSSIDSKNENSSVDLSTTLTFRNGSQLHFDHPIGLAAGYDKDGEGISGLFELGCSSVEIGTVTPKPQPGNPKPRLFRLWDDQAVINRYGFNSAGSAQVRENLNAYRNPPPQSDESPSVLTKIFQSLYGTSPPPTGVLGVNIGKNKTAEADDIEAVLADYTYLIRTLGEFADYLVLNVSSPNTAGLRDLQHPKNLQRLLSSCLEARDELKHQPPVLVKLAPDLTDEELQSIADSGLQAKVDGMIVTNTTNHRPSTLKSPQQTETGGLSGQPLKDLSTTIIRKLYKMTNGELLLIGVGGIASGADAYEKLRAGASVVQLYSSLVYGGPGLVSRIRTELQEIMELNGHRSIQDVVGLDHDELFWKKKRLEASSLPSASSTG